MDGWMDKDSPGQSTNSVLKDTILVQGGEQKHQRAQKEREILHREHTRQAKKVVNSLT
jgi:hypothetical protein